MEILLHSNKEKSDAQETEDEGRERKRSSSSSISSPSKMVMLCSSSLRSAAMAVSESVRSEKRGKMERMEEEFESKR